MTIWRDREGAGGGGREGEREEEGCHARQPNQPAPEELSAWDSAPWEAAPSPNAVTACALGWPCKLSGSRCPCPVCEAPVPVLRAAQCHMRVRWLELVPHPLRFERVELSARQPSRAIGSVRRPPRPATTTRASAPCRTTCRPCLLRQARPASRERGACGALADSRIRDAISFGGDRAGWERLFLQSTSLRSSWPGPPAHCRIAAGFRAGSQLQVQCSGEAAARLRSMPRLRRRAATTPTPRCLPGMYSCRLDRRGRTRGGSALRARVGVGPTLLDERSDAFLAFSAAEQPPAGQSAAAGQLPSKPSEGQRGCKTGQAAGCNFSPVGCQARSGQVHEQCISVPL